MLLKLSDDQKKTIETLHAEGKFPTEIQKILGLKYFQPIYNHLHKTGLYVKRERSYKTKYEIDDTFFDVIDTEEKAYVLGFIVADGNVGKERQAIVISLNQQDEDVLVKIAKTMKSTHPIKRFIKDKKYNHCLISLNSKKLKLAIEKLGVLPAKSLTMDSTVFSHVPQELKRHFLRGYFDGDGSMTLGAKYSSGVKFLIQIIGTEDFLTETFQREFPSTNKLMKYKTCDMYCWKISSKQKVLDFLSYLYDDATIYLDRKYNKFRQYMESQNECVHVKPEELLES